MAIDTKFVFQIIAEFRKIQAKDAITPENKALMRVEEMEEHVTQIPRLAEERTLMVIEKKEVQKLRKQHTDTVSSPLFWRT